MKWIIFFISLFLSFSSHAFTNEPDGFRGFKWGSKPTGDLKFVKKKANTAFYLRKNEKMKIGAAKLNLVAYAFYKNKLISAMIRTKGYENRLALLAAFKGQFGEANLDPVTDSYSWFGEKTYIFLDCNVVSHDCSVLMTSVEMDKQKKSDIAKAASNAAGDF